MGFATPLVTKHVGSLGREVSPYSASPTFWSSTKTSTLLIVVSDRPALSSAFPSNVTLFPTAAPLAGDCPPKSMLGGDQSTMVYEPTCVLGRVFVLACEYERR